MSYQDRYFTGHAEDWDGIADDETEGELPNVAKCDRCGENFIAEFWWDECGCDKSPETTPF